MIELADIVLNKICKSFGDKAVLSDFSAVFPNGKTVCIMGESGCGKTTLLNILMGFLKAESGEITGLPAKISAVFQEDRLCEELSSVRNIRLAVGKAASKEEIEKHLSALGLSESLSVPARELSGGMKRRTAIARCVLADSELMIFDEPFKGLDENNRRIAADYILQNAHGRTIIVVTHDEDDAVFLNGEIFTMKKVSK